MKGMTWDEIVLVCTGFIGSLFVVMLWYSILEERRERKAQYKRNSRAKLIPLEGWPELAQVNFDLYQAYVGRDGHE